ncbi:MAG: hypothetical protein IJP66_06145 [Kiritimatiellae bacterium]|nr:hypothetical protein [Kiritimatiellia bacterium]
MKTILVYTQRLNASYNELFLSLMREGRRRGWCFAIVEPTSAPDEAECVARRRVACRIGAHPRHASHRCAEHRRGICRRMDHIAIVPASLPYSL